MIKAITNINIVLPERIFKGTVMISEGHIASLCEETVQIEEGIVDGQNQYLMYGLIDTHLHGSYGYDFINEPSHSVKEVSRRLPSEGTTAFLASLTVVSHQELCTLLEGYSSITDAPGSAHFMGVHSEGPYLSIRQKALMDERYLKDPDLGEIDDMIKASKGRMVYMTIAPEKEGSIDAIIYLKEKGVRTMIGHTDCDSATALNAIESGAIGYTHLYNAMSAHLHRQPGAVTAAFLGDGYCEMIADGFHLHPDIIRSSYRILGKDRIILITDAMLGKGMSDGEYVFSNLRCIKKGNTVRVIETGRIAGSAITMIDAIRKMKEYCGCNMSELSVMASLNPAKAHGFKDMGEIRPGNLADLIIVSEKLDLIQTFIEGEPVL